MSACTKVIAGKNYLILEKDFMAYNIDELLALPVKERRKISEKLFSSLPECNSLSNEDKATIKCLMKDGQK